MDAKSVHTQVGNDDLQIQEKLSVTTLPCHDCVWTGQGAPVSSQLVTSDERALTEAVYSTLVYSLALLTGLPAVSPHIRASKLANGDDRTKFRCQSASRENNSVTVPFV